MQPIRRFSDHVNGTSFQSLIRDKPLCNAMPIKTRLAIWAMFQSLIRDKPLCNLIEDFMLALGSFLLFQSLIRDKPLCNLPLPTSGNAQLACFNRSFAISPYAT